MTATACQGHASAACKVPNWTRLDKGMIWRIEFRFFSIRLRLATSLPCDENSQDSDITPGELSSM